jgi:hypothetical protein
LYAFACILVLIPLAAGAQHQSSAKQRCVYALNSSGAKVADAVAGDFRWCLALASKGALPGGISAEECIAGDPRGRVGAAQAKTLTREAAKCSELPDFGPVSGQAVNAAFSSLHVAERLLGTNLTNAIIDKRDDPTGAACQKAAVKTAARLMKFELKAFNRCKKAGLADGTIYSAATLQNCHGADPRGKLATAVGKGQQLVSKRCTGVDVAQVFPGSCAGEPVETLMSCVAELTACDCCNNLRSADGLALGCETYVDGVAAAPRCSDGPTSGWSVAREWNEKLLDAIRLDLPRPTVHSRNLFHMSVAMYDAWAAWDATADYYLVNETPGPTADVEAARAVAISFAAYRVLSHRFANVPAATTSQAAFDMKMAELGYDRDFTSTAGNSPAAIGNRIGAAVIAHGLGDGANEVADYEWPAYVPVNEPMVVAFPGTTMVDPNRWQPLALEFFATQNGIPLPIDEQTFVGPNWGNVTPFALTGSTPHLDPGPPPQLGGVGDAEFKDAVLDVIRYSSRLTPDDGVTMDISPGAIHNNPLGTHSGTGYPVNPYTGQPYAANVVKRGDYGRILAEFWADGPDSETPPGHWNVIANYVSDHPLFEKRFGGAGPVLDDLEWDIKLYFAINAAVHDAAIAAWGAKGYYDYVRPISMIRHMGGLGQSSDPMGTSYHVDGLPLEAGLVEVITSATTAPGQRHEHLIGWEDDIAIFVWPGEPDDPDNEYSGVAWVRAVDWNPYQRDTFVTPPFAAYVSGHSTFSRAAAEILVGLTGDEYYPGGLGEHVFPMNDYLVFEQGPTQTLTLQWAKYYDSADEAGISRLWGGIHVRADDFEGRIMGAQVGIDSWALAQTYFDGTAVP